MDLLTEHDTIWGTGEWKYFFGECLAVMIAPYPGLYDVKYEEYNEEFHTHVIYNVNDLLLWCCFIRFYLLIRYSLLLTYFMNPRS